MKGSQSSLLVKANESGKKLFSSASLVPPHTRLLSVGSRVKKEALPVFHSISFIGSESVNKIGSVVLQSFSLYHFLS